MKVRGNLTVVKYTGTGLGVVRPLCNPSTVEAEGEGLEF